MKILSGGQSGGDRAALDAALALALPYGGWCPRAGWAEDFPTPPGVLSDYPQLTATPLADPAQRTAWNLRDADAVMVLLGSAGLGASPGTRLAQALAAETGKPFAVVYPGVPGARARARAWLREQIEAWRWRTPTSGSEFALAIGGPRESEAPGIYAEARSFITAVLRRL